MPRPEGPVARKSDYEIRPVPHREGARFIAQHHYARGTSNTAVAMHGLYRRDTGELVGVAHWLPPTKNVGASVCSDWRSVLALSRLVRASRGRRALPCVRRDRSVAPRPAQLRHGAPSARAQASGRHSKVQVEDTRMLLEDFDSKEAVQDALDNGDEELLADIESSIDEAVRILADRFNKGYDHEVEEIDLREDMYILSLAEHVASMSDIDLSTLPLSFIVDELRQEVDAFDVVECGERYGLVVMKIEPNASVWVNVDRVLENYNLIPEDLAEYFYR